MSVTCTDRPGRARRRRAARGTVLAVALVLLFGACGKRGAPRPPLPRGPHAPGEVTARQLGRRAVVGFQVPPAKGPRPSQQPVRAELVRVTYQPGLQPNPDPDAFRRRGAVVGQVVADPLVAGKRLFVEDLELAGLADDGRGWTLRYGVRVRDRRGRPSPLVVAKDLVMLESVAAPRELKVEPTADGVRLVWAPPTGPPSAVYNVYRTSPENPWPERPLNPEPLADTELLDTSVTIGETYLYTVRVSLSAATPYREGEQSETIEIVAEDRFAPQAPSGLVAVQEGLAVRLFWNPNPERDVAGYRVERSVDDGPWAPARAGLTVTPSFLDADVEVKRRIRYRVTAVDRAEPPNASDPSASVTIDVVEEPVAPGPAGGRE